MLPTILTTIDLALTRLTSMSALIKSSSDFKAGKFLINYFLTFWHYLNLSQINTRGKAFQFNISLPRNFSQKRTFSRSKNIYN